MGGHEDAGDAIASAKVTARLHLLQPAVLVAVCSNRMQGTVWCVVVNEFRFHNTADLSRLLGHHFICHTLCLMYLQCCSMLLLNGTVLTIVVTIRALLP